MKKLLSFALVTAFGVTVAMAQTATTATTTTTVTATEQVTTAAPVIKAVEAEQGNIKCTGTGSCCSHGVSRSGAATTATSEGAGVSTEVTTTGEAAAVETTGEIKATDAGSCHQLSIGVSAAKPEPAEKTEDPKK